MNVVCVGDCGVDHYIPDDDWRPGGITANFSLQARRCFEGEDEIRVIAPLGEDKAADIIRARFVSEDIVCHFESGIGSTPIQHIEIDAAGERHFVGYEEGVLRGFVLNEKHSLVIWNSDLLVAPVFQQNREMFASVMATARQGQTVVDFADFAEYPDFGLFERYVSEIDIAFFGLRPGQNEIIEKLRSVIVDQDILVVVTLGANGSQAFHRADNYSAAALPVEEVIDTTGAGDAFAAGFLSHFCRNRDISAALSYGAAIAAQVVQRVGAN